ncbi:hypothetical protein GCM10022420_043000 [Streptomyces iranensis]
MPHAARQREFDDHRSEGEAARVDGDSGQRTEQRYQGSPDRQADSRGEPLDHTGQTGGPLQRHPAALGRLWDHHLLGQVAGSPCRADQCDQNQQKGKGEQVQGVEQGNRGGGGRAGQIGGPGNGAGPSGPPAAR